MMWTSQWCIFMMMSELIKNGFNEIKSINNFTIIQQIIQSYSEKFCLVEFNLLNLYSSRDLKG